MKRVIRLLLPVILYTICLLFLYLTAAEVFRFKTVFSKFDYDIPVYDNKESYDPSLSRLNTMEKLRLYCDSLSRDTYGLATSGNERIGEARYAATVSEVIRNKFYHGYSHYGFSNNFFALLGERVFNKELSAIVLPEDIVKYPYAACSQQAIVAMELLRYKNITTRAVGFDGKEYGGHFCFEAFYENGWHFFDTDVEPDAIVLNKMGRPDIATLAANDSVLLYVYRHLAADKTLMLFKQYFYKEPNAPQAPRASVYQYITKILSVTFWIVPMMGLIYYRRKYQRFQA